MDLLLTLRVFIDIVLKRQNDGSTQSLTQGVNNAYAGHRVT